MANVKNTKATETGVASQASESVYSAEELAKNHKAFGTSYEIVVIALKKAGKTAATFAEAQKIIDKFKTKEVM